MKCRGMIRFNTDGTWEIFGRDNHSEKSVMFEALDAGYRSSVMYLFYIDVPDTDTYPPALEDGDLWPPTLGEGVS